MAKKGGSHHTTRLAASHFIPVVERKARKWLVTTRPGAHKKSESMALSSVMRDVLGISADTREARGIIKRSLVMVDGKRASDHRSGVGLMDVVSVPSVKKYFRVIIKDRRLGLKEIGEKEAAKKLCQIKGKHTVGGAKMTITMHDGRNMVVDNSYKVGDSVVVDLATKKPVSVLKFEPGAKCLVMHGMHTGVIAKLVGIIERKGSMDAEAKLEGAEGEFVTLAKYLFVVNDEFA